MTLKYLILGGSALLLGFLFFPRGEVVSVDGQDFIAPVRTLDNEPLHYTGILRTDPIVTTYDLGLCIGSIRQKSALKTPMRAVPGSMISLSIPTAPGSDLNGLFLILVVPANIHTPYKHFPFRLKHAGCKLSSTTGSATSHSCKKMRFASVPAINLIAQS